MARRDESDTNRKGSSGSSGQGRHQTGGERGDFVQDCNEYGERYEWIEKANSTVTIRHQNEDSRRQCVTEKAEKAEEVKRRLQKKRVGGGFRTRSRSWLRHWPESGEDADDEESTWSPTTPRPPPIPEVDETEVTLHTAETGKNMTESTDKSPSSIPTARKEVRARKSKSQVPTSMVCREADKRRSLLSVEKVQSRHEQPATRKESNESRRCIHRVNTYLALRSSSNTFSASSVDRPGYLHRETTHSGINIRLLSGANTPVGQCEGCTSRRELLYASPRACSRTYSSSVLQLNKSVVYEHGEEPSTTISFKGHVPPDLLDKIFFGTREQSCPCWPQYDVEHHIGCMSLSDHNYGHVPARPALSDQETRIASSISPLYQSSTSDIDINYASRTKRRGDRVAHQCESTPDERRRYTLVHLKSEPVIMHVGERPHRRNSPALRRSLEASRRSSQMSNPTLISTRRDLALQSSTDTMPAQHSNARLNNHFNAGNKRKIVILK